jgi:hypothetical protein
MTSRFLAASFAVLAVSACSGPAPKPDAGVDAGSDEIPEVFFNVSGKAAVHPDAVNFLADAGQTFSLAGLTVRVEEPLRVALEDPLGVFSTATMDSTGSFSASQVSASLVNLGVAVGIRDDASDGGTTGRVVRSATVIFDVALEGKKPSADITGSKGWAIPTAFHDKLTALVTPAQIQTLTSQLASDLIGAGFILGRVVDASGNPVAGVTVTPNPASESARFFYPSADLASSGTATSSNGLFVYVHNGGDVKQFSFTIAGHTEYKKRSAGATANACLVVTVYPGTTAP